MDLGCPRSQLNPNWPFGIRPAQQPSVLLHTMVLSQRIMPSFATTSPVENAARASRHNDRSEQKLSSMASRCGSSVSLVGGGSERRPRFARRPIYAKSFGLQLKVESASHLTLQFSERSLSDSHQITKPRSSLRHHLGFDIIWQSRRPTNSITERVPASKAETFRSIMAKLLTFIILNLCPNLCPGVLFFPCAVCCYCLPARWPPRITPPLLRFRSSWMSRRRSG